ncbi:MAG: hypothetical protein JSV10_01320, partial [Candidatus Zixiibacteriota bacterium]
MTKKLFVVLVVITAMLVSFSLVIAAKKAPRDTFQPYVKHSIGQQQTATPMPRGTIDVQQTATNLYPDRGTKSSASTVTASGSAGPIQAGTLTYTKDFCDLYGVPGYYITDWFYGLEWYANFQNPEEFGCVDVWPFEVVDVGFDINVDAAIDIDVQGFVYSNAGDLACPVPGAELCQTPVYTVSLPGAGWWTISLPMQDMCCVYEPYFAVIYIYTDLYGLGADPISEDDPTDLCRSYNDYGYGWEDLVVIYGWPGEMILWSTGYTAPQNYCEAPEEECLLQHDNGSASSYFSGWSVGDQNAAYFDPAVHCTCDPVYPLLLTEIQGAFYDFAGVGSQDVIIHVYEAADPCDGPQAEIYSFPYTVTTFFGDWATIPIPDQLCLEEDFFLSVEYNSGITGEIACLLYDNTDGLLVDTCFLWNEYQDYGWIEWFDFWSQPGPGWLMLRAVGTCAAAACYPGEQCDLIQDPGAIAYFFSGFGATDIVAKYFDPEVYCLPPVYPLRISDVQFILYDHAGAGAVDVQVGVALECSDECDGPGTQIYETDPITITTFYGDMANVTLPDLVCVYEPFFITVKYASGLPGETPSFLWSDETYPCDTCHAWIWYESAGYPFWIEWHDFWSPPAGGCPIIRATAYTESPACDIAECDTTLEYLYGAMTVAYYWKQPGNDEFLNNRFEMPADHGGRLEGFQVGWYDYATTGSYGTPDPDMYVWLSDGTYPLDNNPPFQAIAEFHEIFDNIVWFPGYTYFDAHAYNLVFDAGELFHIGGSHAHEAGDTLAWLSDDGSIPNNRASGWDGSAWGGYDPYIFLIDAIICPFAPDNPTFSMRCTPSTGFATPGDPPVNVFVVEVGAVIGYALNVTLSLLSVSPAENITATFNPNGIPPEFDSDVAITVGAGVPYGDYTLTFQGVGDDAQTKTCDVTLRVQPPYDEGHVNFYHGYQRVSNFGAVGNGNTGGNFEWYGADPLYDGSIITVIPIEPYEDYMALDLYDCEHVGFIPNQHMIISDIAGCPGDPTYEELYGEMSYSLFYTEQGEWDSLFVIGLRDVECTDFSIKIKIYYNPDGPDIPEMYAGIFEDWDVVGDDWGEMDTVHNMLYQWDPADPSIVFGIMSVPFYDQYCHNMTFIHNPTEVYPTGDSSFNCGNDPGP